MLCASPLGASPSESKLFTSLIFTRQSLPNGIVSQMPKSTQSSSSRSSSSTSSKLQAARKLCRSTPQNSISTLYTQPRTHGLSSRLSSAGSASNSSSSPALYQTSHTLRPSQHSSRQPSVADDNTEDISDSNSENSGSDSCEELNVPAKRRKSDKGQSRKKRYVFCLVILST
jgi:hypothetical protein